MALPPLDLVQQEQEIHDLIRSGFEASYDLFINQDVCDAATSPLYHFVRSGSFEGRRPAHRFDPGHYPAPYRKVGDSGSDPLFYFLRSTSVS